jgi:hypothetical protein
MLRPKRKCTQRKPLFHVFIRADSTPAGMFNLSFVGCEQGQHPTHPRRQPRGRSASPTPLGGGPSATQSPELHPLNGHLSPTCELSAHSERDLIKVVTH